MLATRWRHYVGLTIGREVCRPAAGGDIGNNQLDTEAVVGGGKEIVENDRGLPRARHRRYSVGSE